MKLQNWTRPFAELTFPLLATHFVLKITPFCAPATYPDLSKCCTCHDTWHCKITKDCACHEKWLSWVMSVTCEMSFTMRRATGLIRQRHHIHMTLMSDVRHILNVICNARSNKSQPPTSPNAAPAWKTDTHDSYETSFIQCAEKQASPSNLTKYCACQAKMHSKI